MKSNTLLNSNSESKMNLNYNKYNNNDDLLNNDLSYKYSNYDNKSYTMKKNYSTPILNEYKYTNDTFKYNKNNYNENNNIYSTSYRTSHSNIYNNENKNYYNNNDNEIMKYKDNEIMKYKDEIKQLKEEITNLRLNNKNLENQIELDKNKFNEIIEMNDSKLKENENLLLNIMSFIKVNSVEEIIPKLNQFLSLLNNNNFIGKTQENIRDELIKKLKGLYITLTGGNLNEDIDIKTLWRWIKHLINTVKQLALEKENIIKNEKDEYKQFCLQLMSKYNIKNLPELKNFIDNSLSMNNINTKQIKRMTQNYNY